jgi:transporter family-2 protein
MTAVYMGIAVGLGCIIVIQTGVNGRLRLRTGDPVYAALISSAIAVLSLFLYSVVVVRHPFPDVSQLTSAPLWIWTGGFIGATYVVTTLVLITRLGSAVMFALIVVGQMLAALVMDHFGLLGLPRHEVNLWRVVGAVFLVSGVVMIRRF